MLSFAIGLLCVSSALAQITTLHPDTSEIKNVAVAVYYESHCPYARAFITDQLYPALSTNLGKYITLTLYPYGKASTTIDANNTYTFVCHHGPDECLGNKYHACALALINNGTPTEGLSYNNDTMKYINCLAKLESSQKKVEPIKYEACAPNANGSADDIKRCAHERQGDELLAKHGNSTNNFQERLGNVPTITLDHELIKDAENHFIRELCKKFGDVKPAECNEPKLPTTQPPPFVTPKAKSGAYAASAAFGVLTVVATFLFM